MELHTLPSLGIKKKRKRKGRGSGSGRGDNGAQSRAGYKTKAHFEGGQTPLQRRLPKRGFKNPNRIRVKPINLDRLEQLAEKANTLEITPELLIAHGVVKAGEPWKVLAKGKFTKALKITAMVCSSGAQQAIADQGGKLTIISKK